MWNVTKTKDKFHISWKYPEFSNGWKILINYTVCGDIKVRATTEQCLNKWFLHVVLISLS